MKLLLPDGRKMPIVKNFSYELEDVPPGNISLIFMGACEGDFWGEFEIAVGPESKRGTFEGKISRYYVPEEWKFEWFGKEAKCWGVDTGEYATSKIVCQISYPIDSNIEEGFYPVPINVYQSYNLERCISVDKELASARAWLLFWQILAIVFIVMFAAYILYQVLPEFI